MLPKGDEEKVRLEQESNDSVVLFLEGQLDVTNATELKELLHSLYEQAVKHVTLDFTAVNGIDSRILGVLLFYQKRFKEKQGELSIRNVTSTFIRRSFQMLHLNRVIRVE